jgi:peptidoglycan/LPS O-acetylase OafA/YrhL
MCIPLWQFVAAILVGAAVIPPACKYLVEWTALVITLTVAMCIVAVANAKGKPLPSTEKSFKDLFRR